MADRTLRASVLKLLFCWSCTETLKKKYFHVSHVGHLLVFIMTKPTTFFNNSINARFTNCAVCTRSVPLATMYAAANTTPIIYEERSLLVFNMSYTRIAGLEM